MFISGNWVALFGRRKDECDIKLKKNLDGCVTLLWGVMNTEILLCSRGMASCVVKPLSILGRLGGFSFLHLSQHTRGSPNSEARQPCSSSLRLAPSPLPSRQIAVEVQSEK